MNAAVCRKYLKNEYSPFKSYANGVSCQFVPFDNCWGIKVYNNKQVRDYNYEWQSKAAEVVMGPDVGSKFQFTYEFHGVKTTAYCFISEKVQPLVDNAEIHPDKYFSMLANADMEYGEMIDEFCDLLEEQIGFYMRDRHCGNFGIKSDGTLVCIDFGND